MLIRDIKKFDSLEFLSKQLVDGDMVGVHRSPYHGFSVEFSEHKQYSSTDDKKLIDWKVFGRSEKLFIKKFTDETNVRCQFFIDVSSSMYFPEPKKDEPFGSKIGYTALVASIITYLCKKQRDAVGLYCIAEKVLSEVRSSSGYGTISRIFSTLENLVKKKDYKGISSNLSKNIHFLSETIPKRSLVIIFSDMLEKNEDFFQALNHLKFNNHEVIIFHVLHDELENLLQFSGNTYQFQDLETSRSLKLSVKEVKEEYIKKKEKENHEIKMKCLEYGFDYNYVDINTPLENVISKFILKRNS